MEAQKIILPAGWRYFYFPETESTNETAKTLAAGIGSERIAVQAGRQTGGRGRRGRPWVSPPGNLYVSLAFRIKETARLGEFSFLTAIALAQAVLRLKPELEIRCKWPNDLLVRGKKLSGILLETDGRGGVIDTLVIGVGVNVSSFPGDGMLYPVTSLAEEGCSASAGQVLEAFAERFEFFCRRREEAGFAPVLSAWKERAYGIGGPVTVNLADRQIRGIFSGLDKDGALLLNKDGQEVKITAGDVFFGQEGKNSK
ncbi:MAG: biotin--[acetyl-CoA-carboxylase] ligase [Alphaproteobacteria bacterium]|mgnify:CR=1 FL=1|jgi:BirA family biotin operon repressor/biotin-[acetyl-CoA-carboxylase] ligase